VPEHIESRAPSRSLRLLGRWQLVVDGADVDLGHREERLAALLGLTGRSSRLHVAGLLWPESTDARALASLRRAVLQTNQRCPGLLHADRLTIGLDADVEVDVDQVRRAAAATENGFVGGASLVGRLAGEELLPGWYDDWVLPERERLAQLQVTALERIARHALEEDDLDLCVAAAHAAAHADPLLEAAAELAIRAHLARGDPGSALLEFGRYRDAVRDELGVPPSRAILDLVEPARTAPPSRSARPQPRAVVERRREPAPEVAPVVPLTAPVPSPPPPPTREPVASTGVRAAVARLAGVAALIVAAALALAGIGLSGGGADRVTANPPMRVLTVDHAVHPSEMDVRLVGAAAGRAAFLVRTPARPAVVRLEVRSDTGANVVRTVRVRSPQGRRLELSGLEPGSYRWLATSRVAVPVSGRVQIPAPPPAVDPGETVQVVEPVTTTASTVPVVSTPPPTSAPTSDGTSPPPRSSQSGSTARNHPTGQPKDPGTQAPGPVG
jgi:DNA-binding SARP family transcriptional activator